MKESVVQKTIKEFIERAGGSCIRVNAGQMVDDYTNKAGVKKKRFIRLAPQGTPDLHACICGRYVAIEVKADHKALKEWQSYVDMYLRGEEPVGVKEATLKKFKKAMAQYEAIEKIKRSGGIAFVTYDVLHVIQVLKTFKLIE